MTTVSITYRTSDSSQWGPGKGSNLSARDFDQNFWNIVQAIQAIIDTPSSAVGIASVTQSGVQITFHLTNGSALDPVTIPVLQFRWRGSWTPSTPYAVFDTFAVDAFGIFSVLIAHTSGSTFDPNILVGGLPALNQLLGVANVIGGGSPADNSFVIYSAGSAAAIWRSHTFATSVLDDFVGDTGSGGLKGLVPAPAAGDALAGKFLKAAGDWEVPSLAGDVDVSISAPATGDILVFDTDWINVRAKYVIATNLETTLSSNQDLLHHRFATAVTIPANFGAYRSYQSRAGATVNATADTVLTVSLCPSASDPTNNANYTTIGSITFAGGGVVGTFTTVGGFAKNAAAGDILRVRGPSSADATLAGVYMTLVAFES